MLKTSREPYELSLPSQHRLFASDPDLPLHSLVSLEPNGIGASTADGGPSGLPICQSINSKVWALYARQVPLWDGEYAAELYDHSGDNSSNMDEWENVRHSLSSLFFASHLHLCFGM